MGSIHHRFRAPWATHTSRAAWVISAGYVALVAAISIGEPARLFPDSARYLPPTARMNPLGLEEFGSTPPGFLTQLLFRIMPTDALVLVQVILSASAWLWLALVIWRLIGQSVGLVAALAVLAWSLAPWVQQWNYTMLSESLSISAFIAWLAAVLLMWRRGSTAWMPVIASLLGAAAVLTRPQTAIVVIPVQVTASLLSRPGKLRSPQAVVGLALSGLVGIWAVLILMRAQLDDELRRWYALTNLTLRPELSDAVSAGLPPCPPLDSAAASGDWGSVYALLPNLSTRCPEADAWLTTGSPGVLGRTLAQPTDYVTAFVTGLPDQLSLSLPDPGSAVIALGLWTVLCLVVGVVLAAISRRRWRSGWRQLAFAGVWAGSILTFAWSVWAADALEVARHSLPISLALPVFALCAPLLLTHPRAAIQTDPTSSASTTRTVGALGHRRLAAVASLTAAVLLAIWSLVAPIQRVTTAAQWRPTVAADASVPLILAASTPAVLDARVPCGRPEWFPTGSGSLVALSTSRDPALKALDVVIGPERTSVRIGGRDLPGASVPTEAANRATCAVTITYDDATGRLTLKGPSDSRIVTAEWVDANDPRIRVPGFAVSGLHTDTRLIGLVTAQVQTAPAAVQEPLWRFVPAVLALMLAAMAIALIAGPRSLLEGLQRTPHSKRRRRQRSAGSTLRRGSRWPDAFVVLALVVAGVVLPPLYDDGWVLTTVRSFPSLGYFSDYFANEATPQPLGFWWSWLAQGWLQPIWLPAIGLRLVPLAICFAVWLVARRILAARLPGDARAPAMWVAAAVYVVSASSWLVTLRPEPVVALLLALQYALVVRFAETPTIVPLAWSGIVSVLALTAHQTGLAVAVASLAIVPGVVAWIGRNRRRWLDLGLLAAGLTMMLAILLTLSSNLAMWLDSRASFAEGIAHDRLLDEVARIATLNAGLVTPLRRLSVALLAIGLVGFLVRPRGWLPRPLSTVGLAAVLSVAGLALTVSKWPWHYGALAPSAAVLAGLTAAWLWGGSREQVSAWRVAGFGFAIAGASFWAALSQELWAPTSLAGLTPLAIVRAREWGPLSTDELLLWVLLAALAVALAVIVRTRQRRSLVALSVFSAACLGLVTALSVGPLVVDAAVSGTPSWIGQTAAVAAGNTCGAAGSTGFAVPVDPQPLAGRTGPPLGAGAAVAEATPPLAPPVPGLAVFVPAGGSDPTRPVASPWQELPMGVTARIWLRTGPGFVDATVQTASVDGGDLTEQRVSTPAGVPAWRLIEVEAASMPRILRTSWTPAQSSVSGATAAVSSSRTEPLNSLTTTAWVNPATYLYTPCLLPPSIAGGIVADVQWSVGLPDILGRSLAFEGVVTEMDCQGVALSADRLCATTVSLPTSPSLTVTSIPIQQ